MRPFLWLLIGMSALAAWGQQVPVREISLDNGMKLLLVPRKGAPNIAAGWVAKVGSVHERPGITGTAHLFEHMMFKGTHAIGTRNIEEDLRINLQLDQTKAELRKEERELARKYRLGLIAGVKDPAVRSERHQRLLAEFEKLNARQKELLVKNEFDRIYTNAGASGLNAGTSNDFTIYFIQIPANKLELWFWMESDRLANPVFREFYSERDVVHEERRLRVDSTPTGKQQEEFDAMFWKSSPYGWPVIGWPSDLEGITREEATAFFGTYYAPNNLTACLVGDFDPEQVIGWAQRYFGRLRRGAREPEPVRTVEEAQYGERRMLAEAETVPQVVVRYHTVADGHQDDYPLSVMAYLLSGRTGRLYKSLVLEQQLANAATADQRTYKYEGYFQLRAIAKPGKTLDAVEQALYQEIEKLQKEPVPERELKKIKNQLAASKFRSLQSDFFLMQQLLVAESSRGWQAINTDPPLLEAVTAEDVQRVAKQYFPRGGRNVLHLVSKPGAGPRRAAPAGGGQ